METDNSGNVLTTYNYGKDLISMNTGGSVYCYHYDALGTTRQMTDSTGTVVKGYTYDGYGNVVAQSGTVGNTYGFTGQQQFAEGDGLVYLRARYYQPSFGRFVSRDPIGYMGGLNLYDYVRNNPLVFVDPFGLDKTYWDIGDNGRWGPRNGNWGGGNWSGGWVPSEHNGQSGPLPPTDSADECYMAHDNCYDGIARCPGGAAGKKDCDYRLVQCLKNLPDDPRHWPHPPRPGTEEDSSRFRRGAITIF